MYEKHFGLRKSPFAMTPDPSALFLTDAHREALAGLSYAVIRRKGFVVLSGEAGTGKTTLLRKLLETVPETEMQTSVVLNPILTPAEFLELLLINLGVQDLPGNKARCLLQLECHLIASHNRGKVPILIVDEAHKLSPDVLEEIRLLTNFETGEYKLLQIVLAGQPELDDVLRRPELWQLKQRVAVRLRIGPLSRQQVAEYMHHRWVHVGGGQALPFGEDVVSLIALYSRGIPRLINSICDNGLLLAFSGNSCKVSAGQILDVVHDLDLDHKRVFSETSLHTRPVDWNGRQTSAQVPASQIEPNRLGMLERHLPEPSGGSFLNRWTTKLGAKT